MRVVLIAVLFVWGVVAGAYWFWDSCQLAAIKQRCP